MSRPALRKGHTAPLRRPRWNLYRWQEAVAGRLVKELLLVAAQPGSGKTITLLTAAADGLAAGGFHRILVSAPRLILDTVFTVEAGAWEHTAHLCFDLAHQLTGVDREYLWFRGRAPIVTTTPDLLPQFVEAMTRRQRTPVDAVFVDEAQAFKNPATVRSQALLALASVVRHVALSAGTPTPNGPIDGWMPGRIVSPGNPFFDPSFQRWRTKHFIQGAASYIWHPRAKTDELVAEELAKVGVSMQLRDTSDVPMELYSTFPFEHSAEHRARIRAFMTERRIDIAGVPFDAGECAGGYLTRLHQLTNGFAYVGEPASTRLLSTARVNALREVVESQQGPVLVATRFKADIALIRTSYPNMVAYDGDTPVPRRRTIIDDWNADRIPLLVAHPGALGHGVNLQHGSARTLIWFSGSWSWELFAQMNARLIRAGQTKRISIVTLASDVGIDAAIAAVIAAKASGEAALMAALKDEAGR